MKKFAVLVLLAVIIPSCFPARLAAADLTQLIKDSQRTVTENNEIILVWWITEQFWTESFKKQPNLTDEHRAQFAAVMKPYTVFCVAALDVGPLGGLTPRDRETVAQNIELIIGSSKLSPLSDTEISADAKNFYDMMKPMLAGMLGQLGKGMEFFVYSNEVPGDTLNPLKAGGFTYKAFEHSFKWRLPLGSLLPAKVDQSSGEEFPGDYNFNPYTGKKLSSI